MAPNTNAASIPKMLPDLRVLVCRPEPGATELTQVLSSVGAECLKLPMLETNVVETTTEGKQHILNLDEYDHVIVVSQHAARIGLELIDEYWPQLPLEQKWYPIGRKTASVLNEYGVDCYQPKQDLTSESLVKLDSFKDLSDSKILMLKGAGGRALIKEKLGSKAKQFDELVLYKREMPEYNIETVKTQLKEFQAEVIVALSGETLSNLLVMANNTGIDLSNKSFILSSERVANIAYEAGIKKVFIPNNLMPIDIIKCLKNDILNKQLK